MERYTYQQFTHDVMTDTDASLKRGGPVTVHSMVEDQGFVSSCIVAQKDKLPKEVVEHHKMVLQGIGLMVQVLGK